MTAMRHARSLCLALALSMFALAAASAQRRPDEGEIRGLKLGLSAAAIPTSGFGEFACGSNGGAPRGTIEGWTGFAKCRAEPSGLHEVYVRFDDEDEYIGKAIDDPRYTLRLGTRIAGHPVILSLLFDDAGVVRGLRAVSDPRAASNERRMAHMLRLAVINRYNSAGWACTDFPAADGETAVGGVFLKQRCTKDSEGRVISVEARFLRKPGQSETDPTTGEYRPNQFESWTRFEIFDPAYRAK